MIRFVLRYIRKIKSSVNWIRNKIYYVLVGACVSGFKGIMKDRKCFPCVMLIIHAVSWFRKIYLSSNWKRNEIDIRLCVCGILGLIKRLVIIMFTNVFWWLIAFKSFWKNLFMCCCMWVLFGSIRVERKKCEFYYEYWNQVNNKVKKNLV